MDPSEIRELIELISRSNFSEFELERDDFKLKLVKQQAQVVAAPPPPGAAAAASTAVPVVSLATTEVAAVPAAVDDGSVVMNSPIVGTFYRSPGPDAPSFVDVGSRISKGQVICIVEAMKVMNEIEAEIDGEVVEVLVANGQPVEYGEALFRLRPTH